MTSVWDKYFVPFDSILINNSCKYFLHLQLFSEYEEVLNTLWSYMKKKKLSRSDLKPFENTVSNTTVNASDGAAGTGPKPFKLFANVDYKAEYASIIWTGFSNDKNRSVFYLFLNKYFAIGDDDNLTPVLSIDMSEDQYGEYILKKYITDMISIYGKSKDEQDEVITKNTYTLTSNKVKLLDFLNAIVNIVLFCKLKEEYSEEKDCYNNNLFNKIIQDFNVEITADDAAIKQEVHDAEVSFRNLIKRCLKNIKENKPIGRFNTKDTKTIYNELIRRANENGEEKRRNAKKDLIKDLEIILKREELTQYIQNTAFQRLMKLITDTAIRNTQRTEKPNLVTHIDSIYTKLESNQEEVIKMQKHEFKIEFYDRYNLVNFKNIQQIIDYCLEWQTSSTISLKRLFEKYGAKYKFKWEEIREFFMKFKEMYNIKEQNYPNEDDLNPGSHDDEYKKFLAHQFKEFVIKQNNRLKEYEEKKPDIFNIKDIKKDLDIWVKIEKHIKSKISVINWILLYQSRLDRYIYGQHQEGGYNNLTNRVESILKVDTNSAKLFNQYKDYIELKIDNIRIRGIYETIGWHQYSPESDLMENYYLYKTFAVANEGLITKLTTKEDIELKKKR